MVTHHHGIRSPYFFRDGESNFGQLQQHVQDNDYFGTLATRISMMDELINKKSRELDNLRTEQQNIIREATRELTFLQESYTIQKR